MRTAGFTRIAAMLAMAAGLACQNRNEKPQAPVMNTDIQELAKLIQLPVQPTSVKWIRTSPQIRGPIGPNDSVIVALLEYSAADMEKVRAKLDAPPDSEPMAVRTSELPYFFSEAESAKWDRPSKDFVVPPGKTFGAGAFAKSPYLQGKSAILDGHPNQVLIALYTS